MTGELTITLPWPPKELSPNAKRRKHWRVYQPIAKQYRHDCFWLTRQAKARGVVTAITFRPPDKRRRDFDGMIGSVKHAIDGVADALGIDDHHFRPTIHFDDPVAGGAVLVTVGQII